MFSGVDGHTHQVRKSISAYEDDASADQWLLGTVGIS